MHIPWRNNPKSWSSQEQFHGLPPSFIAGGICLLSTFLVKVVKLLPDKSIQVSLIKSRKLPPEILWIWLFAKLRVVRLKKPEKVFGPISAMRFWATVRFSKRPGLVSQVPITSVRLFWYKPSLVRLRKMWKAPGSILVIPLFAKARLETDPKLGLLKMVALITPRLVTTNRTEVSPSGKSRRGRRKISESWEWMLRN